MSKAIAVSRTYFYPIHAFLYEIFVRYVVYCQNKPKSEHIVSEHINDYFEVRLHEILSSSDHQCTEILLVQFSVKVKIDNKCIF